MDERVARPYQADNPQSRYVTTSSGYITHRLTGQFTDTAANYEGMWPIDHDTAAWPDDDPAAYAATGMPRDMLFDLVSPGGRLGQVTPEAAGATGIRPACRCMPRPTTRPSRRWAAAWTTTAPCCCRWAPTSRP